MIKATVIPATGKKRSRRPRGWRIFLLITTIGLLLSSGVAHYVYDLREQKDLDLLQRETNLVANSLQREIDLNLSLLEGLQGLFLSSDHVSREEFATYTRPLLLRHPHIKALEWAPTITHEQRQLFETQARDSGLIDFGFTERSPAGDLISAQARNRYFPVYYLEPLTGNESALGFDLGSNLTWRRTLEEALQSHNVQLTAPITLVQEGDQTLTEQRSILFIAPVSRTAAAKGDPEAQNGFVLSVLPVGQLLQQALNTSEKQSPEMQILLWDRPSATSAANTASPTLIFPYALPAIISETRIELPMQVPGRNWILQASPGESFGQKSFINALLFLTAGILLSLLVAAYIRLLLISQQDGQHQLTRQTRRLLESEKKLSAILETAVDPIITIDARGHIQLFNPGAEKLFGYAADEVIGKNVRMLMPEPNRSKHDSYLHNYLTTGEARIIGIGRETVAQRKDGTLFPMQLSVGHIALDNESLFVGTLIDLTLQKESEAMLLYAKNEAENANRQKSEFVNMMSHELRTPLTVILGYIPLLKQFQSLPDPSMITGIAEDMETSGNHLLHLINDLLDLSKMEAGRLTLRPEWIEAQQQVDQALQSLSGKAAEKGLQLQSDCKSFKLFADPVRIQQILINLIGNAIKFTQQGEILVSAHNEGQLSYWQVIDSGCGIAPEDQARVFEKFRQIDSSSTRNTGGTGLGLAITRQLVTLHGGTISLRSTLGEGSTFEFTLNNEVAQDGKTPVG